MELSLQRAYQNLENVFTHGYHALRVSNNSLVKASLFYRVYYYILSFFSFAHFNHLNRAVIATCQAIRDFAPMTEQELIIHQKATRLMARVHLRGYSDEKFRRTEAWDHLCVRNKKTDVLKPFKDGKFYYNNPKYKRRYWHVFLRNILLLFPGTFKKPTKTDLNQFMSTDKPVSQSKDFRFQWIGHSSFLVQVNNQNILIDPNFSSFVFPCFKRYTRPGIDLKNLPKIDTTLISHNHLDHLDEKTLRYFVKYQPTILVPMGLKEFFEEMGFEKVIEHNWFDETSSKKGSKQVQFTCTPSFHWSQPLKNLKGNQSLWCSWVIQANGKTLFHAGDTAFSKEVFEGIKSKFPTIHYALLPIAPEDEEDMHMGVESFFKAKQVLKPVHTIPMHYLTFRTGAERVEDPYNALKRKLALRRKDLEVDVLKIGQVFSSNVRLVNVA